MQIIVQKITIQKTKTSIQQSISLSVSKCLAAGDEETLTQLHKELINKDWFMTLLDLKEYIARKEQVLNDYADRKKWAKKMLINIAKAGFFSSDRTIAQYNEEIWKL